MTATREIRADQHGTLTGYAYGCRCGDCTDVRRAYMRGRRAAGIDNHRASPATCDAVLEALIAEADMDGLVVVPQHRLAELVGMSSPSVYAAVQQMAAIGRISIQGHHSSRGGTIAIQLQEGDL